jgi:hypothetical protein
MIEGAVSSMTTVDAMLKMSSRDEDERRETLSCVVFVDALVFFSLSLRASHTVRFGFVGVSKKRARVLTVNCILT